MRRLEKSGECRCTPRRGALHGVTCLSERLVLRVIRISASALRYQAAPDRNKALRERIVAWLTGIVAMALA